MSTKVTVVAGVFLYKGFFFGGVTGTTATRRSGRTVDVVTFTCSERVASISSRVSGGSS